MASSFTRNDAWRAARRLVKPVYVFAQKFPPFELFGLGGQMRDAVHSVHLNIAEGHGRLTIGEWEQFLGYARGSLMELEPATVSAFDLNYCTQDEAHALAAQVRRVAQLVNGCLRASRGKRRGPKVSRPANGKRQTATVSTEDNPDKH